MKPIDENDLFKTIVIVLLFLILIMVGGISNIYLEIKKGNEILTAGQNQIAGFMMVPGLKQTGPITIFYDKVEPKQDPGKPHKKVNEKAQPKKKGKK